MTVLSIEIWLPSLAVVGSDRSDIIELVVAECWWSPVSSFCSVFTQHSLTDHLMLTMLPTLVSQPEHTTLWSIVKLLQKYLSDIWLTMAVKGAKALEVWARRVTDGYPNVKIRDMSSSWKNGLAFCAIIHRFRPQLIDFHSLDPDKIER